MPKLSVLVVSGMVLLAHGVTYSQAYPSRPIRLIVPYPAGSATDLTARDVG